MKIIKTNEVENHHIFALIVGASGVGKTKLASTLNPDETIILSLESGLLSVKDSSIDAVEITSYKELINTLKELKATYKDKYKNIFIDSLTEISENLFTELEPNYEKAKTFNLYSDYKIMMIGLIKALRGTVEFDIWITCLDKISDMNEITMDMHQKSLSKTIPKYFDEVFYMKVVEHEGELRRVLGTDTTVIDFAKDRSGKLNKYELPDLTIIKNKIFS